MKKTNRFLALIAALPLAAALSGAPAHAQGFGGLGGSSSGGLGNAASLLSGSGVNIPSVSSLPSSNVTGLLSYCVQNNYLQGNSPSTLLSSLKQKSGLDTSGSQYTNGQNGILDTGNGNTFSLSSLEGNLKQKATKKVCSAVLKQGKSLL
ncbi:YjjA family protein [Komagataeibacter sp. FNDCF1]|uniref:YjjA family protein n=1 Tax=Komagataeibacter sp. FNDCF1 TaxID=2878681 RepID=UPI001E40455D|nr:YjjA family protein [Komagataeibacter sp. FNDCF1]MCE2565335.1 YjjA family protein [Komagataeibacter sp. FNDCF1]